MTASAKIPMWKFIVTAIALALSIVISQLAPPEPLTDKSMVGLGIFFFFVICSMIEILPDYIGWLMMCTAWGAFGCVPFAKAFGFFVTPTWWLVVGAMVLAAAVAKCGLLKRIALAIMTKFPVSYKWQSLSLLVAGSIINPMIPSGTVKNSLMAPFALSVSDIMHFPRRSKGAAGLFCSMFLAIGVMVPAMLSATFINYVILGMLGDYKVSFGMWALGALPWTMMTLFCGFFAIQFLYKVDTTGVVTSNAELVKEREALGPMSRDEKITLGVLLVSLVFWITERMHEISATTVVLVGVAILCTSNVIDRKAFRGNVTWDALIFMGCAISMTTAFPAMNIDKWIGAMAGDILVPIITQNILLFIVVLSVIVYVIRLFMTSQTAFCALFMVFLVPAGIKAGIHPWILGFMTFTAANTFIVKYQNIQYLPALVAAETAAGENFVEHKQIVPFAVYYMISNIVFLALSIPFWKLLGWM